MNVLAAAVARIMRINPTMLDAYDDALLLVNGVYKPTQITPTAGSPSTSRCWHTRTALQRPCLLHTTAHL
jgi:hypothetical protein